MEQVTNLQQIAKMSSIQAAEFIAAAYERIFERVLESEYFVSQKEIDESVKRKFAAWLRNKYKDVNR